MRVAAVIPARMQSVRLPGKPLRKIAGVPMILRVLDRARACSEVDRVIVATDSEEILRTVEEAGGEACLTSSRHRTGSDRVAEAAEGLSEELILNIQGDEPLLPASTVRELVRFGRSCPDLTVVTAMVPLRRALEITDPNNVKVVVDSAGRALLFSRYPIPYHKDRPLAIGTGSAAEEIHEGYHKHIGIYLYSRMFLLRYVRLEPTPLEKAESLEQLRVLEHGLPVYVVPVTEDSVSVDTEEDLRRVEELLSGRG